MVMEESTSSYSWSWEQEKAFENAIAGFPEDKEDRWEQIASAVPGKTIDEIKQHYQLLVDDIENIESGRVSLPSYAGEDTNEVSISKKSDSHHVGKSSRSDQERRKGIAWTEEEHRQFLLGLEKYGKGDWRSISRNFVVTRTPTQVASHAQKYFIRLNSMNKDRRRSSIHDITSVGNGDSSAQGPITGQGNAAAPAATKSSTKTPQTAVGTPGVGMYGTAVGTPVSAPSHMAYSVRAPISGAMVPGAPVSHPTMAYPMPSNTATPR